MPPSCRVDCHKLSASSAKGKRGHLPTRKAGVTNMTTRHFVKSGLTILKRRIGWPVSSGWARVMALRIRPPAFVGAYPDRETALAHVPIGTPNSHDHDDIAPLIFSMMCATHVWDHPVMFWLERIVGPGQTVLDAGGHFGTKFIAYRDRINLDGVGWRVYDVPATVKAARKSQETGVVPGEIDFVDELSHIATPDTLLASGLLQFFDVGFRDFVGKLAEPPRHILLNKAATADGPTVVTLEKIVTGRIPYQIRNRGAFERSITDLGDRIRDTWQIPSLARTIATHPWLGASTSRGYVLEHILSGWQPAIGRDGATPPLSPDHRSEPPARPPIPATARNARGAMHPGCRRRCEPAAPADPGPATHRNRRAASTSPDRAP